MRHCMYVLYVSVSMVKCVCMYVCTLSSFQRMRPLSFLRGLLIIRCGPTDKTHNVS